MSEQDSLSGGCCGHPGIDDGGLDQVGGSEGDEKQLDSGHIFLDCIQSVKRKKIIG